MPWDGRVVVESVDELLHGDIDDVSAYANRAREVFRTIKPLTTETWTAIYERGVQAALAHRDMSGLITLVSLVSSLRLEVEGRLDDAFAHVGFALSMAAEMPDETVAVLSRRAPFEAVAGDLDVARATVAQAAELLPRVVSEAAIVEYRAAAAAIACIGLDADHVEEALANLAAVQRGGSNRNATFVISWLAPLLFAVGRWRDAMPWVQTMRVISEAEAHPWRVADAELFTAAAAAMPRAPELGSLHEPALAAGNWLASWRARAIELHWTLLAGDTAAAREAVRQIEVLQPRAYPGFLDGAPLFRAVAAAWSAPHADIELPQPVQVTVMNLGAAFAGMEAVAIAGSQRHAAAWLRWSETAIPAEVVTAAEWPASRDRLRGLLALRAGDVRAGIRSLRRATRWAERTGYEIEAAVTLLQLAEASSLVETGIAERLWRRWRQDAWARLEQLGVQPTAIAYFASAAVAVGTRDGATSKLSPREVEVLALLAEGLTYREAAARLGTQWRTVQTQATRIYSKLGVRGRVEAITAARQHGIL